MKDSQSHSIRQHTADHPSNVHRAVVCIPSTRAPKHNKSYLAEQRCRLHTTTAALAHGDSFFCFSRWSWFRSTRVEHLVKFGHGAVHCALLSNIGQHRASGVPPPRTSHTLLISAYRQTWSEKRNLPERDLGELLI